MKNLIIIFGILIISFFCCFSANASNTGAKNIYQLRVIAVIKKAESYIKKNGIEKTIIEFKYSKNIVIGNYSGMFFVSPLHPELIGKNQFDYKDPTGALVVQEEINKAKAGGGWLKGRWRKNSITGKYQCRKIYILPIAGNYYIGSWYHYFSDKPGVCLI
jgi:signal transduction histidine kinase